jgi:hypothetical protein
MPKQFDESLLNQLNTIEECNYPGPLNASCGKYAEM